MLHTLFIIALIILIPIWLEWLWWRKWFGFLLDDYYYLLAAVAGLLAYHSGVGSWLFFIFFAMAIVAMLYGVDRLVRHR